MGVLTVQDHIVGTATAIVIENTNVSMNTSILCEADAAIWKSGATGQSLLNRSGNLSGSFPSDPNL